MGNLCVTNGGVFLSDGSVTECGTVPMVRTKTTVVSDPNLLFVIQATLQLTMFQKYFQFVTVF